jgi:hypothetical protein
MIEFTIDVNTNHIIAQFEQLPAALQVRLRAIIQTQTERLLAMVQGGEPVRTGALRSHTTSFIDAGEDFVRGRVRILNDASGKFHARAGALEYGAHRATRVSAHQMMLGHAWGAAIEPRAVMVEAYTRQLNLPELRFLRGPFEQIRAAVLAEVQRAVDAEISRAHSA